MIALYATGTLPLFYNVSSKICKLNKIQILYFLEPDFTIHLADNNTRLISCYPVGKCSYKTLWSISVRYSVFQVFATHNENI